MSIYIDPVLCKGCGVCVSVCSQHALSLVNQKAIVDINLCNECRDCITECPQNAISFIPSAVEIVTDKSEVIANKRDHQIDINKTKITSGILGSMLVFITNKVAPLVIESLIDHFDNKTSSSVDNIDPVKKNKNTVARNNVNSQNSQKRKRHRYGQKK